MACVAPSTGDLSQQGCTVGSNGTRSHKFARHCVLYLAQSPFPLWTLFEGDHYHRHHHFTPSYKKTILGSKQPISGIDFFFRFSPRLSENDYSWVKFIPKFGPTASNLRYFGLYCCVFPVNSVVRGHERVGYERKLLISLEKHSNLDQNNANWKLWGKILQ